ncbi:MAG: SDR family NAD(P)-dependent oxidoreductase [Phenylobacterium sp.]|uniref:SDR family NAD(P)-dependent oxidoreductase n=1 Tax=Phenylobacterium sp. TaxID=1871053 RepID=UPI0008CD1604|nr:SDR family NAD(P)-dependent oxidoreductase [Phenylobacterium sp.]MBA4794918.1 SDR family NAD(P)-dependent oxidoreductase [Phenylobacterium sp.]OHB39665.1 MAG: 3-oxoacyl-[acyl-carrier-protein] reductase [Phenylobacterium sp. RIFCSPHIGHO2_01_FULL_70_10]
MSRVVAVTGAFGVLGEVVATAAAAQGARLALIEHAPRPPEGLVEACGAQTLVVAGVDLADPAAAQSAMDQVADRFGGLDALINIAGGFRWQTVEAGDPAQWDRLFAMNLRTALNASRAALPLLKASPAGRIVNVGAAGALKAAAGMGAYAASKAAVHKLTESLAEELKADGITVNAVLPSIIDTPANRADMPDADFAAWVAPADLAAVILFLASESARAVTGALVPVTGRV